MTDRTLERLSADRLEDAVSPLGEVAAVRGFGPVKEAAMRAYADRIAAVEGRFAGRAAPTDAQRQPENPPGI